MKLSKYSPYPERLKIGDAVITITALTARASRLMIFALGRDREETMRLAIVHGVSAVENLFDANGEPIVEKKDKDGNVTSSIGQVLYDLLDDGGKEEARMGVKISTAVIKKNAAFGGEEGSKNSKG